MTAVLQLLGRDGCHLCQDATTRLSALIGPVGHGWELVDVDTDPELRAEWGDMVPVLLVGERVIEWGTITDDAIRTAVAAANDS